MRPHVLKIRPVLSLCLLICSFASLSGCSPLPDQKDQTDTVLTPAGLMKLRVETFGSVSAFDREKDMALRALTCLSDTPSPDGRVFSAYLFVLSERGDRHRIVHHITMDIWTDDKKIAHVQERHYARMLKKQNDLTEEIRNLALNAWAQAGLPLNPKCQFRSRTDSLLQRPAPTDFTQSGPEPRQHPR